MEGPTTNREERERRLDEAVTAWLKAVEQGAVPNSQLWLARYPELAEELSDFFASQAALERLAAPLRQAAASNTPLNGRHRSAETLGLSAERAKIPRFAADRSFGEYELLEEIARGGMGVVYKARQKRLNRTVAVKMVLAGQLAGNDDIRRFLAEAEAAAGLDHPGIVPVYESGEIEGQHFFSMGYVEGQSLAELLSSGPLSSREAAALMAQVADAVEYAHQHGVIHRDLKPGNILLDRDGCPRVTDFGLAKRVTGDSGLTHTGQALGTPSYMPPEQAAGKLESIGPASDVYALGAVLYAALTGRPPFQAASQLDTLRQVVEQEPAPPRQLNANVARDLETIALKCLQKEPHKRYATAAQFADELRRYLADLPIRARPVGLLERSWRSCRRNPATASLAAIAVLLLAAVALVSTVSAVRLGAEQNRTAENLRRAETAEQDALEKLRGSYLAQARSQRTTRSAGQRFASLAALCSAAEIQPGADLRDEAIACLALTDIHPSRRWNGYPAGSTAVAVDRNCQRYARSDSNGAVQVRGVTDDRLLFELPSPGPDEHVWVLGFSPDGRYLGAVHHPNTILHVWQLENQQLVLKHRVGGAFEFHSDGRRLAFEAQSENAVHLYDLASGEFVGRFPTSPGTRRFALHAGSDEIAIAMDQKSVIALFDLKTQRRRSLVSTTEAGSTTTTRLAWSPDGHLLADARSDNRVYVYDAPTGALQSVLSGHQSRVTDAAFNPGADLLATSSWDGTVRFWDPWSGLQLLVQDGAAGYQSLGFSRDGNLFGPTVDGPEITLWRLANGRAACATLSRPKVREIKVVDFSRDGQLMASINDVQEVGLWDVASRSYLASLSINAEHILFDRTSDSLLTAGALGLHRWPIREISPASAASGVEHALEIGPPQSLGAPGGLSCVASDSSGNTLAVAVRGAGQAIILREDGASVSIESFQSNLRHVALSPDGQWLLTGTWFGSAAGKPKVWNATTGKLERDLDDGLPSGDCTWPPARRAGFRRSRALRRRGRRRRSSGLRAA